MFIRKISAALAVTGLTFALAACGTSESTKTSAEKSTTNEKTTGSTSDAKTNQAASVVMEDPWVKAADTGMTAAFGSVTNRGKAPVNIVSASGDMSDMFELHETVAGKDGAMMMRPKKGGFNIKPSASQKLEPGGDHIMIMKLKKALKPGAKVSYTLKFADGSTKKIDATVKPFDGADEKYAPGTGHDMGGHGDSGGM